MDKAVEEVAEAAARRHKERQSRQTNWAPVSLCQASSDQGQKQYYIAVGLAKRKNNSCCVLEPLEHPNSWEIGGLSVAPVNGT